MVFKKTASSFSMKCVLIVNILIRKAERMGRQDLYITIKADWWVGATRVQVSHLNPEIYAGSQTPKETPGSRSKPCSRRGHGPLPPYTTLR